jgi:hypothetical protein
MSQIASRLRPSSRGLQLATLVLSCMALFVALGGPSYAARTLIGSKQLKKNAVSSKHVGNNTLTGRDVKNRSLTGKDVRDDSLSGADIDESTLNVKQGGTGPRGAQGETGPSAAYSSTRLEGPADIAFSPAYTIVDTLTVPGPGNYVVNAKLYAGGDRAVRCQLGIVTQSGNFAFLDEALSDPGSGFSVTTMPLQFVNPAPETGRTYGVRCRKSQTGAGAANIRSTSITAIKVGTIVDG